MTRQGRGGPVSPQDGSWLSAELPFCVAVFESCLFSCILTICQLATDIAYMNGTLKVDLHCKYSCILSSNLVQCGLPPVLGTSWFYEGEACSPLASYACLFSPTLAPHTMAFQAASASLRPCIICIKVAPGTGPGPKVSLWFLMTADPTKKQACAQRDLVGPCLSHGLVLSEFT